MLRTLDIEIEPFDPEIERSFDEDENSERWKGLKESKTGKFLGMTKMRIHVAYPCWNMHNCLLMEHTQAS